METGKILKIFMNFSEFRLEKANFNKSLGKFDGILKIFHNANKIKKPFGKFLRVWTKNQLRFEIYEKILKFTYKNLNGKLIFYPFSLASSRTFVI